MRTKDINEVLGMMVNFLFEMKRDDIFSKKEETKTTVKPRFSVSKGTGQNYALY